ncbi:hypothetical protein CcaCcLH18_08465 [Colletotrichum camelliae]|nr:hypothetical protein CcaCcLH18_08465 [Colletotrichum camelliae]
MIVILSSRDLVHSSSVLRPPDAREIDLKLQQLCSLKISEGEAQNGRTAQKAIQDIQLYLGILDQQAGRHHDEHKWSPRPRIYAILRNINGLQYMNNFAAANITDFHLPFNNITLPSFVADVGGRSIRKDFLKAQDVFLTETRLIEKEGHHLRLPIHTSGDDYYTPMGPLGQGSFGAVDRVFSRLSTRTYARKRALRARTEQSHQNQASLLNELQELKQLRHQHLIRITGSYTDREYIAYLMEPVADCTLAQFLGRSEHLDHDSQDVLRRFYGCLAGAVDYLHQKNIRHRDLSSHNVLVCRGEVYVSDFGSAYNWTGRPGSMTRHRATPVSPDYMAPEIAQDKERGTASDMWSLGIIYLEMTTKLLGRQPKDLRAKISENAKFYKNKPFPYANIPILFSWIKHLGNRETRDDYDKEPLAWTRTLLDKQPENRPSSRILMQEILESPSFGTFCCFKCQPMFQDGFSEEPPATARPDADSKNTTTSVEHFVEAFGSRPRAESLSTKHVDSIQEWISGTATKDPADILGKRDFTEDGTERPAFGTNQRLTDRLFCSVYEPQLLTDNAKQEPGPSPWEYMTHDVPMPGSFPEPDEETQPDSQPSMAAVPPISSMPRSKSERGILRDSGLGFLERESVSSADGDQTFEPFEEVSDCSTVDSDDTMPSGFAEDTQSIDLTPNDEEDGLDDTDAIKFLRSTEGADSFLFGEVEDVSEPEDLFDEVSDRSESEDPINITGPPNTNAASETDLEENEETIKMTDPEATPEAASQVIEEAVSSKVNETVLQKVPETAPNMPLGKIIEALSTINGDVACADEVQAEEKIMEGLLQDQEPVVDKPTKTDDKVERKESSKEHGLLTTSKDESHRKIASFKDDHPVPNYIIISNTGTNPNSDGTKHVSFSESNAHTATTTRSDKSSQRDGHRTSLPIKEPEFSSKRAKTDKPSAKKKVSIEAPTNTGSKSTPKPPKKPAASSPKKEETTRQRRARPEKRELPSINVEKLMDTYQLEASSTATSEIGEEAKSRIVQFFLLMPSIITVQNFLTERCREGKTAAVRVMLENIPSHKKTRSFFRRPVWACIKGGSSRHNKCLRALIEAGAKINYRNKKTGKTTIQVAVEHEYFKGYTNLIWLLMSSKEAEPNVKDSTGDCPMTQLFSGAEMAQAGAPRNSAPTPLSKYRLAAMAILLQHGTDVNSTQPGTGNSPLHLAVRRQDELAVAMLLYKKAKVNATTKWGISPLNITANQFRGSLNSNHAQILDLLLREGAAVNEPSGSDKRTALHRAVASGTAQAVEILLRYKADPDIKDGSGKSARDLAVEHAANLTQDVNKVYDARIDDHMEIMERLFDGCKTEWPLNKGRCPVNMACRGEGVDGVSFFKDLFSMGLQPDAKFGDRGSIAEMVEKHGSSTLKKLFVKQAGGTRGKV